MSIKKLSKDTGEQIQHIFHLSDIHIRLYHRLDDEYEHVFQEMYKLLEKSKESGEKCLVVLTGDILHNKNDLSPECILTTLRFLNTLSSYFPTLFIAGNHDTLLNNLNRIDSLSAILAENHNPNLHYLKYSGWYQYENIVFGVSSLLDNQMTQIKDLPQHDTLHNVKRIALYHGGVGKFSTNKGFVMEGIPMNVFDNYDMVMLGDIHLHQYLDKKKRIAYAGSMIAQNFGETDPNHGVLKWDTDTHQSSLIVLDNPYRYCQAILKEDHLCMDDTQKDIKDFSLPEKCRLKLVCPEQKSVRDIENLVFLRNKYPLAQIQESLSLSKSTTQPKVNMGSNNNFLSIIHDYFSILPQEWTDKDQLLEIILAYFKDNLQTKTCASHFEILDLEFHYMFGYGPNIKIDFSRFQKHQTIGIFGRNSSGKSTLIEVILFLLYGCITRYKHGQSVPPEVIHFQQKNSSGKIRFRSHNIIYEIQKKMTRSSNTKIKVDEKLFKILPDGTKLDLSEEHRKKTDKFVISQIGTPSQFLFTNVFLQTNEQSFRSMTPKERKDFLYDILELSQLEEHYQLNFSKWKENKHILDQLEKDLKSLHVSNKQIEQALDILNELKQKKVSYENDLGVIQKQIREKLSLKKHSPLSIDEITNQETKTFENLNKLEKEESHLKKLVQEQEPKEAGIDPEIIEQKRSELWEEIDSLYKKIQSVPSVEPSFFRFDYQNSPIPEDVEYFRRDVYLQFMDEYQMKTKTPAIDETGLISQKEQLLSSLYPEVDPPTENTMLQEQLEGLQNKISTTKDIKNELDYLTNKLFSVETELSGLEQKWKHKWEEWEKLQKEPDIIKFMSDLKFNRKCCICSHNREILQTCLLETEEFKQKKKELWDEISPSKEEQSRLKEKILETRKMIVDLREQEKIFIKVTRIQHILHNRITRKQIDGLKQEIDTIRCVVKEKQEFQNMKKAWEQLETINKQRLQVEEKNQKIKQKIQKKKQKVAALDRDRKLLDQFNDTQMKLKEIGLMLENSRIKLTELETWRKNLEHNIQIDGWILEKEKEETFIKSKLDTNTDTYIKKQQEYNVLEQQAQMKKKKEEEYNQVRVENELLSRLLHILHRDSLPMYFLEKYLPHIENRINSLIGPFLKQKKIVLRKEQKKESVNVLISVSTLGSETNYLGGMEGFIVDASIKEVLAEVSLQCKSNLFIIDEGISALDKKNMENLDQFFHFLEERHPHVFIISHLNEAQSIVRHSLLISKEGEFSKIDYV
jgi:DNA repair exonuclease SbcCD ATPase subunit